MPEIPSSLSPNQPMLPEQASAPQMPEQMAAPQAPSPYTIPLLQNETNVVLPVEQSEADVAIRSGLYSPNKAQEFVIQDKYGAKNIVTGEYLKQALDEGFRLESTEERHARELEENYGGVSGVSQALGAGAARGATVGLSDLAASAASPEAAQHLANLQEANPIASGVGEAAGFVGGMLLGSAETSLAARGAGTLVKGIEKVGVTAAKAVEKSILKDAAKVGVSKKIAASLAAKATGGAVEGAFYGTGQLISEDALGKADFNAENLAGAVGMGAIIGGAFGVSIGVAQAAMPLVNRVSKSASDYLSSFTNREKAALEIMGFTPAKAAKVAEKNPTLVSELPDFLTNEVKLVNGDDAASLVDKLEVVRKASGTGIGDSIAKYDKILASTPDLKTPKKLIYKELASELDDKFMQLKSGSPESRAKLKQAGAYYDELIKSSFDDGAMSLKALQEARQNAYNLGYTSTGAPVETLEGQMARYAGRFYSDTLKDLAKKISKARNEETLYEQFIKNHKSFSYASELLPKLKLKAAKGESLNPIVMGALGAASGGVLGDGDLTAMSMGTMAALGARSFLRSDLRRNLVVLGKIEKSQQQIKRLAERSVEGFVGSKPVEAMKRAIPFSIMQSEFAKTYEDGKYRKPKDKVEAFSNLQNNLQRYADDPEAFMKRVNRGTSAMYSSAPNTSTALDSLAVQAAMYVGSKMPKRQSNPGPLQMLKRQRLPADLNLSKLERTLNAVENPKSVFEDLERGRLSTEGAEALKSVYPSLYTKLQEEAMKLIGSKPVPYNKRLQLGILLGIPTDESLQPENILGLQQSFGQPMPEQGGVKPTVSGLNSIDTANRMQTDTQDEDIG
jgi:hypothetical protein